MTLGEIYDLGCCAGVDARVGDVSDTPSSIAHEQISALREQAGRLRMAGNDTKAEALDARADAIEHDLHQKFLESEGMLPKKKSYLPRTKARIAARMPQHKSTPSDDDNGPQVASAAGAGPGLPAMVAVAALLGLGGYAIQKWS